MLSAAIWYTGYILVSSCGRRWKWSSSSDNNFLALWFFKIMDLISPSMDIGSILPWGSFFFFCSDFWRIMGDFKIIILNYLWLLCWWYISFYFYFLLFFLANMGFMFVSVFILIHETVVSWVYTFLWRFAVTDGLCRYLFILILL